MRTLMMLAVVKHEKVGYVKGDCIIYGQLNQQICSLRCNWY